MGRRDRERIARIEAGKEQPRSVTNVITERFVRRVEAVGENKEGVLNKLIDTWKKDMKKEIKKQGIEYLENFDIDAQFKENMATIESNHMLKHLVQFLRLTEAEIRDAMVRTLAEVKEKYGVGS